SSVRVRRFHPRAPPPHRSARESRSSAILLHYGCGERTPRPVKPHPRRRCSMSGDDRGTGKKGDSARGGGWRGRMFFGERGSAEEKAGPERRRVAAACTPRGRRNTTAAPSI